MQNDYVLPTPHNEAALDYDTHFAREPEPQAFTRMRDHDKWRPIPEERRFHVTIKGLYDMGEVIPERTNGLLCQVRRPFDDKQFFVHYDNIEWPPRDEVSQDELDDGVIVARKPKDERVSRARKLALALLAIDKKLAKLQQAK